MNGILIVDKPADWTSHDVVAKLRGALKEKRIGHGGTLDPLATGVLPVFIGRATRAAEFCENAQKEYIAGLRLGIVTDTQDITGNVIASGEVAVPKEALVDILPSFTGAQKQVPPMYSAIKIDGQKLYKLARRGIEVHRPARDVTIYSIELFEGSENEYSLRIVCSKGTYIRTLCNDIGAKLGCGGVMSSLRRTRSGSFMISSAHKLEDILKAASSGSIEDMALPVDTMFLDYPALTLSEYDTRRCKNGASCHLKSFHSGKYRLYSHDGEFLAFGNIDNGELTTIKSFYSTQMEEA